MTTPEWLNQSEQAAWRAWLDMYRLLLPELDRRLQAEAGSSLTDFEVLVHLSEAPGRRLRMGQVAERTVSTRSAVTRTIDRLVGRDWVRRVRVDDDQRGYFAELTDSGAAALSGMAPGHVVAVRDNLIDLLTPAELEALRVIGDRVRMRMAGPAGQLGAVGPTGPAGA